MLLELLWSLHVESEIASPLAEGTFLDDDLLRQLMAVGEVDLLVGISSHGDAKTTDDACLAVEQSFQQNFTRQRAVIINASGRNQDEAASARAERLAQSRSLRTVQRVTADFSAPPSPGMALRTILTAADLLRARACAVVSPATTSLTPEWVANLLNPTYQEKFDFVAPLYTRQKFEGLLARNLLYPMSRAIFGCGIRELYSDEWGFSGRLAVNCLKQDVWHEDHIGTRPEAWMAISALPSDFRCCQVFLGQKLRTTSGPGSNLIEVFRQTVGSLFWCMESKESEWLDSAGREAVQTFGPDHDLTSDSTELNRQRIFDMFRTGVTELEPILSSILDPETHAEIKAIVSIEEGKFRFRPELWVRTLYDFAASYHHTVINRDHLVQALAPLYRGVLFSYLVEHSDSSLAEIEAASEALCLEFQRQKPYLREKWKTRVEVKL